MSAYPQTLGMDGPTKPKVTIEILDFNDYDSYAEMVIVTVNKTEIGRGHYGGEPEDNRECRDYSWVKEVLTNLAVSLGAEVKFSRRVGTEDDE